MQPLDINQYTESLNKQKDILKSNFVHHLEWNTLYRYLLLPLSPYAKFSARVRVSTFQWSGNEQLLLKPHTTVRKHFYENRFTASCSIRFDSLERQEEYEFTLLEHTFDLTYKCYFDLGDTTGSNIELLDERRMLMSNINDSIFQFYQQVGINSDDFDLGGEELSERFRQALFNCQPIVHVEPFTVWFEILYCLQRVRFSIGNMFLYRPYLDNPIWHGHYFQTGFVYPSYTTLYDERYFTFCEFTYQSLYHFWDRVGDTLAVAIPTNIPANSVDFVRIVDAINNNPTSNVNPNFQWLANFKTNEYKVLNDDRKQTVHYETITSRMNRLHIKGFANRAEVEQRQEWIEGRIDYFVDHFHKCVEGLRQLTLFLETK